MCSTFHNIAADHRRHQDNLVRLTRRHFPSQSLYEGQAKDKSTSQKIAECVEQGVSKQLRDFL